MRHAIMTHVVFNRSVRLYGAFAEHRRMGSRLNTQHPVAGLGESLSEHNSRLGHVILALKIMTLLAGNDVRLSCFDTRPIRLT